MDLGRLSDPISLQVILAMLDRIGISYEVYGQEMVVDKVCSIRKKENSGLYYLTGEMARHGNGIKKSIIIVDEVLENLKGDNSFVVVDDPQLVFYKLCQLLFEKEKKYGVHPTAVIHEEAEIDPETYIGPYCVVGKCKIKRGSTIHPHVVIYDSVLIGENVTIEAGSCIGATGVSWVWDKNGQRVVQPQVGGVLIEDGCFIGTNVTVVRGSVNEFTEIGRDTMIAHGTKIGHGAKIGPRCHLANNVTIAGNAQIGEQCFLGAGSVVSSHVRLARDVIVGAGAVVVQDVNDESVVIAGVPAKVIKRAEEKHRGVPRRIETKFHSDKRKVV